MGQGLGWGHGYSPHDWSAFGVPDNTDCQNTNITNSIHNTNQTGNFLNCNNNPYSSINDNSQSLGKFSSFSL